MSELKDTVKKLYELISTDIDNKEIYIKELEKRFLTTRNMVIELSFIYPECAHICKHILEILEKGEIKE